MLPAIGDDTCASMARDWALEVDFFRAMSPLADYSKFVLGQVYRLGWEATGHVVAAATSATSPTVPHLPLWSQRRILHLPL